ncbi:hypothetical protein [Streptomyces subrutilus]|uniref:hypothetical protein n=1 Tax=Streptomyces subrutilus TaxID=36818 RepID=UPI0033C7A55C
MTQPLGDSGGKVFSGSLVRDGIQQPLTALTDSILKAGEGGTITSDMIDNAGKVSNSLKEAPK